MFRFFNAPRVSYSISRPTIYLQRYNPIESYLLNSIRQAQEYERFKYLLQRAMIEQQKQKEEEIHEKELSKENNNEEKIEKKEDQICKENLTSRNAPFYYFESHSRFDGEKLVEERKERKVDSDGKVHQTLKRRLGNQWYQTEQIKDKEGKETVKEAWHNVPEEEVDSFKQEWINHIGYQNKKIEDENSEKDEKEEAQNEIEKLTNEQTNEEKDKVKNEKNEAGNENEIKGQNENEKVENENEVKDQKEQQISNDVEEKSE